MKVLIGTPWASRFLDDLRSEFPDVEFAWAESEDELVALAPGCEAAVGPITEKVFAAAKDLRWIQSTSAGVEWMARIPALADTDIIVTNTRGAHASTIAEHTLGMLVFLARGFADLYEAQKRKEWVRPLPRPGVGLAGLTMGIIGLGNIGRAIAERAHAMEMTILAVDAHEVPQPECVSELRTLDGLTDLLQRSDVVVVATPITEETRGMLGAAELAHMKPTAYLMVMSRGGIIDEDALVTMLQEDKLAGAGLDVAAVEPLPEDSPLWDAPNIFITPHSSPSSQQTAANVTSMVKTNLTRFLAGEPLLNVVDKKLGY